MEQLPPPDEFYAGIHLARKFYVEQLYIINEN